MSGGRSTPATDSAAVCLEGVEVVEGGQRILGPVDWRVDAGQRWVVLGPNGAGKTTLIRVAGAWRRPSRGHASVLGERIGRVDVRDLRRRIGWVGAEVGGLLDPRLRVAEVVASGREAALTRTRTLPRHADEGAQRLLARVGVAGMAERAFATLSQGERARVLLARALAADPALLLLDEPFAGLDLAGREQLVEALATFAHDPGAPTLVLVTHHVEDVPPGFTHAALVRAGRLEQAGPLADTLTSARLSACFGLPLQLSARGGRYASRKAESEADSSTRPGWA